ncbi:polyphosphate kinase 1 [Polluticaenibacter yanchengensis]|uniref:Polyphosphate kinase n=1 Tax=Polluticaenibacter yanchengensis TaxID=3014562 RepID=A0ABT4UHF6_9BACT|nr:polyphosphate kinase 1 [Chitinophagaceae bacterium LY-5]
MKFINRDTSWLGFNERVLLEAGSKDVPLIERLKFLSIFSSNLDEFSRVRIPSINAEKKALKKEGGVSIAQKVKETIEAQQNLYGATLAEILSLLKKEDVIILYKEEADKEITDVLNEYFFSKIASYLHVRYLDESSLFFPENHFLYLVGEAKDRNEIAVVNIPSEYINRFLVVQKNGKTYFAFIDDILRMNLGKIWIGKGIEKAYSIKVSRNAELFLEDEEEGNLLKKVSTQITKRDTGLAARLLYDAEMPASILNKIKQVFGLENAMLVEGGRYHNLKDLNKIAVGNKSLYYPKAPVIDYKIKQSFLFDELRKKDVLLHLPFHKYDTVLRFFNEASLDPFVTEINMTVYRLSHTSQIAETLISAAGNGKKVTVFVELKARFDEANNIVWAEKMRDAGVKIIYSIPNKKVHAKVVLVKRKTEKKTQLFGILGTGNFNELTALFYTDHIYMTSQKSLLNDLDKLFKVLKKKQKQISEVDFTPSSLLIAPFNLKQRFYELIDREIAHAKSGRYAYIRVKFNNLEDKQIIKKLYEASNAGVRIDLMVRAICCLNPGVKGQSELITVCRVVDRYLEHGRIFYFENGGDSEVFLGSSDWMTRNIDRRVEVCFPVLDKRYKKELTDILDIYFNDGVKATGIKKDQVFKPGKNTGQAQVEMFKYLAV